MTTLSFLPILFAKGLVKAIKTIDNIINITVCAIKLWITRLNKQVTKAATPNQNTKKPTVAISTIKHTPAIISQICLWVKPVS